MVKLCSFFFFFLYFSFKLLKSKNYHFNYKISLDGNEYIYTGIRFGDNESFDYNSKKYYRSGDIYYISDNTWQKNDDPYKVHYLLEPNNLETFIKAAFVDAATQYSTGKGRFELLISSNTVVKLVSNKDTDIEEIPNKFTVYVDEKREVEKIEMNLDNYCKVSDDCTNSLKLVLEYTQRGEIQEITNPINN